MNIDIIIWLDYIGTAVFAISGVLTAGTKKLDLFGVMVIGVVTAIGGGTMRDLLLGVTPVTWLQGYEYLIAIFSGFLITLFFKRFVAKMRRTLFLFDTIGIGVFTIIGLEKALNLGVNPAVAVIMGMTSAVVGGVIRDTLTNEVPLIFHKEIYATACITGALFYLLFRWLDFPVALNELLTVGIIITIRLLSIRFNISIPVFETPES
ncbi:trimeric intracellular cation channel family protein [Marinilabilia sp.]|uniref:trimeric intracellular cation channel family protein n=1 Tax=Marinilabilia sp. TaxID=2021252 RepID=UPI0025C10659|nr:trimeric intracellular cation channel family protein [Marinilabilia sp.]